MVVLNCNLENGTNTVIDHLPMCQFIILAAVSKSAGYVSV